MIEVLQSLQEVEAATQALQSQNLPTHITPQKNWDQWLLSQVLQKTIASAQGDRSSIRVLDLGCGDCCTLDFLAALGFKDLHGIDLTLKTSQPRLYQLYAGDLTATGFADASFEVAISISVIEHGVDLDAFFEETYRLLKSGGFLFVTTDYWQDKISIDDSIQPFGLQWSIFSKAEIEKAIAIAKTHGFILHQHCEIPACAETTVSWYEKNYTFIALAFRKL